MSVTITPSIGRKVWFWPGDIAGKFNILDREQACDATIVYVHDGDRHVNLRVTDHDGWTTPQRDIRLVQHGEERPSGPHATWMPFQVGQAARHEAGKGTPETTAG